MAAKRSPIHELASSTFKIQDGMVVVEDYFSSESPDGFSLAVRQKRRTQLLLEEQRSAALRIDRTALVSQKVKSIICRYIQCVDGLHERAYVSSNAAAACCQRAAEVVDTASLHVEAAKQSARGIYSTPPRACKHPTFLLLTCWAESSHGVRGLVPVAVAAGSLLWGDAVASASLTEPDLLRSSAAAPFVCSGSLVLAAGVEVRLTQQPGLFEVSVLAHGRAPSTPVLQLSTTSHSDAWNLVRHIRRTVHERQAPRRRSTSAAREPSSDLCADGVVEAPQDIEVLRQKRSIANDCLKQALEAREHAVAEEQLYRQAAASARSLLQESSDIARSAAKAGMDTLMRCISSPSDASGTRFAAREAALRFAHLGCETDEVTWGLHLPQPQLQCACKNIWTHVDALDEIHGEALFHSVQERPQVVGFDSTLQLLVALLTWLRLLKAWEGWKLHNIRMQQAELDQATPALLTSSQAKLGHNRRQDSLAQGLLAPPAAALSQPPDQETDETLVDVQLD